MEKMIIKQFSCAEGKKVDMRQANAVLKYKPNVIIREAPNDSRNLKTDLKRISKKYPWVMSDVYVFENIEKLLKSKHKTKIYNVDAPSELLRQTITNGWNKINRPRRRGIHLMWWVYIYLREFIMTKRISKILSETERNSTVLILMQKFHWLNVKFQMSHTKAEIWNFYFGKFNGLNPKKIKEILKRDNLVLYKYWENLVS